ncbi:membrane protein [Aliidongia dinghuensis]|uniref:Membrane protein n=1 Tax=Aliidongia dinghuensis TaxID=1867774 RepID=A0A8J2YSR0_9PROT|nr:OmpA family protein [Aliidongia dinghuensis]GGF11122.1 membrane protein [Aliidongia dinghuensis]
MIAKFWKTFVAGLVLAVASTGAYAQVQQMGATPKPDDLIKALKPDAGAPGALSVRGIRVLNATPGGATAAAHPSAVALDVKFALGSADLTDAARQTIGQLAKAIKSDQLAPYRFQLSGHTDSTGKPDANMELSQRRAEAVKAYLVDNLGVAADRLQAVGRGQEEPLDPAHPESGVNRRVQVAILGAK